MQFEGHPIISEQVNALELAVIMRELRRVIGAEIIGDLVELGCYEGTTSLFLQRELIKSGSSKRLWIYDSFAGLPKKTTQDSSPAGLQFKEGELAASKQKLITNFKKADLPLPKIKKAWFSDLQLADMPDKIAFAFLDGDYYESIIESLRLVWPLLQPGSVVVVDDYINEALPGASRAVEEWLKNHPAKLRAEQSLAIITPTF